MNDTIAALATPPGRGAIAIVRVSGPEVSAVAQRLVPGVELQPRYAHYAAIVDERGEAIDRGVAIFAPAPHSYTGEDTLELQIHGSPVVAREVLRALFACGVRLAEPGEFTRRAFMHGKMDLHAAAAVADLIDAETRSAARAALANLGGGLAREVQALRARLVTVVEECSGAVDFPEEVPDPDRARVLGELDAIAGELARLLHDGEIGRLVREGVSVAIVGPPNAGKSSLLNALLGEERAIVSEIAGTTRDTIEESIAIDGVRVRLVDTAGIRAHADRLEAAGIERSQRALAGARIALLVLDGSAPLDAEARALLAQTRGRERVVFFNKADLGEAGAREAAIADAISGSVYEPGTIRALRRALARVGWGGEAPDLERPHLASLREFDAAGAALRALDLARATLRAGEPVDLIVGDLQEAYAALGHVTGDVAAEEVLGGVFNRFCIGK
ncbi:MAG TPA: tRNA uridine-5-carboxymethylaminomethyl(34) synthesis GTPase MnmE [Candidatus Acidoferrales bacterium]|nr:tRNA uridine-5-carboxymethylaminomethyl(34) synthesis GTPase MnmE [Candidatus Acidoferrales bacterium]